MPVKVLASDWDVIFGGSPNEGGTDDDGRARDPLRGRQRREDHQHEPRPLRSAQLRGRAEQPDCSPVIEAAMRYAVGKGCFIVVAGGNEFEDTVPSTGQPDERHRRDRVAHQGRRVGGGRRSAPRATPTTRAPAATSSWRRRADRSAASARGGFVWQQTFDFDFDRHVPAAARRSTRRRDSTSSATSATSARRWPRRTSPASRRC